MPISNVEHSWEFFNKLLTEIGIERDYNSIQDLRNLMFNQYPNLMKINECKSEKMFKVKSVKRSFSKNDILTKAAYSENKKSELEFMPFAFRFFIENYDFKNYFLKSKLNSQKKRINFYQLKNIFISQLEYQF